MNKIYTILLLACCSAGAQVPNADFETGLGYGLEQVASWGQLFLYPVTIDIETGESTADEIIFEDAFLGGFCSSIPQSHSGERAMQIRNAFNATRNEVIPGQSHLFNSEISETPTGWNFGIPVEANADIDFLSFWYKFEPLGNDVAEAKLTLYADGVGEVGSARILISEATSGYTYTTIPVTFTSIETPTFMNIDFTMQAEGSTAVFGSRLTIDDLAVNNSMLQTHSFEAETFAIFPTITQNTLNIQSGADSIDYKIIDLQGKTVQQNRILLNDGTSTIDVSALSSGVYLFKTQSGAGAIKKFIKK